jgi:D-3-phosphoglycerate dehydrogenase / 2-oxoglutarate reductase
MVMMQKHTLILEPHKYSKEAISVYEQLGQVQFVAHVPQNGRKPTVAQKKKFAKTDILVVRNMVTLDKAFLDFFPNLKIMGVAMTGLNHIDLAHLKKIGVIIFHLKGQERLLRNVPAVAEKTMGFMISLSHKLAPAYESVKKGNWHYKDLIGNQLAGKTIGIIGLGRLGKMVAHRTRAFDMHVISTDPNVSKKKMERLGVQKVSLEKLLRESDVVSIHASLEPNNIDMLKTSQFKMMKPNAIYINTARGELNDEQALCNALKNKWIAGAAFDVLKHERRDGVHLRNNLLVEYMKKHDNLIIIPHTGGFVQEGLAKTENFIAKSIQNYINYKLSR